MNMNEALSMPLVERPGRKQSRQIIFNGYTHGYWETAPEQAAHDIYTMYDKAGMIREGMPPVVTVISADTIPELQQLGEVKLSPRRRIMEPITPEGLDKIKVETFAIFPGGKLQVLPPQIQITPNVATGNHIVTGNHITFNPDTNSFDSTPAWQRRVNPNGTIEEVPIQLKPNR
jgi:hypothetical protein